MQTRQAAAAFLALCFKGTLQTLRKLSSPVNLEEAVNSPGRLFFIRLT